MKKKAKKPKTKKTAPHAKAPVRKNEYPIEDDGSMVYVQHPVLKDNGKWVGADVLKSGGYISLEASPSKVEFDTEEECQKACDAQNAFYGWDKNQANAIIAQSMDIDGTRKRTLALRYIKTGAKNKKFWNEFKEEWNDYGGSVEIYEQKKSEGKINTKAELAVLCLDEAELWFEGFEDDSEQNRIDFTSSLFHHIIETKNLILA